MLSKQIKISTPSGTGNQSYTGIGFQGKLLIIEAVNRPNGSTHTGTNPPAGWMLGMAISSSKRQFATGTSDDAAAVANTHSRHSSTACIGIETGGGTLQVGADFVSWDADGFTLNWTTLTSPGTNVRDFYCTVLGGSDFQADMGIAQAPGATGNQSITGMSFQPNCLVFWDSMLDTSAPPANSAFWWPAFGVCDSAGNQWAFGGHTRDAVDPMVTSNSFRTACLVGTADTGGVADRQATFVSYNSDGFTINWGTLSAVGQNTRYLWCAMSVPYCAAGTTAQRTTTGTTTISALGFTSRALMFGMTQRSSTGGQANLRSGMGIAVGTAAGDQRYVAFSDEDALATSDTASSPIEGKAIGYVDNNASSPTVLAEADISAIDGDSFTINWTTVDATARLVGYLAMGDVPAVTRIPRHGFVHHNNPAIA